MQDRSGRGEVCVVVFGGTNAAQLSVERQSNVNVATEALITRLFKISLRHIFYLHSPQVSHSVLVITSVLQGARHEA